MTVLQVKEYNNSIASQKWDRCDKTKCVPSMFYFYLDNEQHKRHGYNIGRKKGYVVFDDIRAVFGMTEQKALDYYNGIS